MSKTFTFSTGRTVKITPISPWILNEVRQSVPRPTPPKQMVEGPDGPHEVENFADPAFLETVKAREREISRRVQKLILLRGTSFEVDTEAVAKLRADMQELSVTLPPEAADDRHAYLYYVCPGSAEDMERLMALIEGQSLVTEEAVAQATETF